MLNLNRLLAERRLLMLDGGMGTQLQARGLQAGEVPEEWNLRRPDDWTDSAAREHLAGLALDTEESWALSELTRENLQHAADETSVFAVVDDGMRGAAYRTRTYERESDGEETDETEQWAEYGIGAWADLSAARSLFAAISADAAAVGADRTRVLIPETPQYVSDAAWLRAGISEEPDFVLEADLNKR